MNAKAIKESGVLQSLFDDPEENYIEVLIDDIRNAYNRLQELLDRNAGTFKPIDFHNCAAIKTALDANLETLEEMQAEK